jgi:hypothetical protein
MRCIRARQVREVKQDRCAHLLLFDVYKAIMYPEANEVFAIYHRICIAAVASGSLALRHFIFMVREDLRIPTRELH